MKKTMVFSVLLVFGLASASSAGLIDFRSADFALAHGQPSFYYNPAGLTIEAGSIPDDPAAKLYWDSSMVDGLGVYDVVHPSTGQADEVDGIEFLLLHFDIPQHLNAILITDLYYDFPCSGGVQGVYRETGYYSFDATSWVKFEAADDQKPGITNGELTLDFAGSPMVTDIWFQAPGWITPRVEAHTFSVAAVDVNPVPEPATMLLLGTGLVGLAGFRRRFKK